MFWRRWEVEVCAGGGGLVLKEVEGGGMCGRWRYVLWEVEVYSR